MENVLEFGIAQFYDTLAARVVVFLQHFCSLMNEECLEFIY